MTRQPFVTAPSSPAPDEPTLRERKKLQTRAALHEAARRLVEERGLDGVTVEDICAAAGVSPRTFFNYFSSKAVAALGLPDLRIPEALRARFLGSDGNLVDDLCALASEVFTQAGASPSGGGEKRHGPFGKHSAMELVAKRPELLPELTHAMIDARRQFVLLAAERAPETDAMLAGTLVMAGIAYTLNADPRATAGDLGAQARSNIAAMCALAGGEPRQTAHEQQPPGGASG